MKRILLTIASVLTIQLGAQNALNFDGNDDYVSTSFQGISGSAARTVEAWVRTTAIGIPGSGGGVQRVILDWGNTSTGARFTLNMLWNNAIRLEVGGNGVSGTTAINDGNWHHVACVWDPNLSTNKLKLYVDGVLDVQGTPSVTTSTGPGNLVIGRRVDGVNPWDGDIDEVRIWNRALTQAELAADRNAELCSYKPGLVAYYKLNEGTAGATNTGVTTTTDEVAGANGTLNSFALTGNSSNWITGANLPLGGYSFQSNAVTACNQFKGPGGITYDSSGTYVDTLQNVFGCDSVIETVLTITTLDVSVTVTSSDMTANKQSATYRWLDCDNNYAMVTGGTQRTFTPPNPNGTYAVQVKFGSCTDTSACYQLDGVSLEENHLSGLQVFPNPSTGVFTIKYPKSATGSALILDVTGKSVLTKNLDSGNGEVTIDLGNQPKGVFFIKLEVDGELLVQRLIVE